MLVGILSPIVPIALQYLHGILESKDATGWTRAGTWRVFKLVEKRGFPLDKCSFHLYPESTVQRQEVSVLAEILAV